MNPFAAIKNPDPESPLVWPDYLKRLGYPRLIIDVESTGFSHRYHRINMIGHGLVSGNAVTPANFSDATVNLPYDPYVWGACYLKQSFEDVARQRGFWNQQTIDAIDANSGSCLGVAEVPLDVQQT